MKDRDIDLADLRVINASGRLTALGGCTRSAAVLDGMRFAAGSYVEMEGLHAWASARIAELVRAEDAEVVGSASAGIVLAVAALVAGTYPERIRALPDAGTAECRIAIQAGHLIDFGAPIAQMIRLGGGSVVFIGSVNRVQRRDLDAVLRTRPAGLLYVQSHHAVHKGMVALDACVEASRAQGVPVVVETAAESDLAHFLRLGADLVIYSGSKDLLGPTGGLVLGRRALVDAVRAQSSGIGRAMKIGKEAIVGMVDAIDGHMAMDHASSRRTPVRRPIGRSAARVARRHGARGSRDAPAGHRAGRTPVPWSAADMDVIEGALRALRSA